MLMSRNENEVRGQASAATAGASEAASGEPTAARDGVAQLPEDPRQGMSPTALKILAGAQRLLEKSGFLGLTLRAIAAESGENSAMVQYYFGSKDGLVRAMIDSVFRDDQKDAAAAMSTVTSEDRLPRFIDGLRMISSSRSYKIFFDILPYALRNAALHTRMARAYDSYRRIKGDWLRGEDKQTPDDESDEARAAEEALLGVSELMTAVVDGLAIQEAIDDTFDMGRAYAVLEFMLQRSLPELLEQGLPAESAERVRVT